MKVYNAVYRGVVVLTLVIFFTSVKSQSHHFIYILADHQQPFYVRTKDKVYSSNNMGYLIMPRLLVGKISFTIGFPKNKWKSSRYAIEISENDLYLSFKQVDTTTWGLYEKQTNLVFIPEEVNEPAKMDTSKDSFSIILAEVSDNPTILQQKKKELQNGATLNLDTISKQLTYQNDIQGQDVAVKEIPLTSNNTITTQKESSKIKNEKIDRTLYLIDSSGISIGYEIFDGDTIENVVLFIPIHQKMQEAEKNTTSRKKKRRKQQETKVKETVEEDDLIMINKNEKKEIIAKRKICDVIATEADFRMIRKIMASEDDEERMVIVADTGMRNSGKCYSSSQVKNLAVLFLNDFIRFKFIESAIELLTNFEEVSMLESLFQDEENRNKLKTAIEKKQR